MIVWYVRLHRESTSSNCWVRIIADSPTAAAKIAELSQPGWIAIVVSEREQV